MRTRIAAVLLGLLLALSLAGCVRADRAVKLRSDGSGVYTYTIGLSDQLVSISGSSLTASMNKYGEQIKQGGGSYSRYEDSGYSYWKYVRPFQSVSQLNSFLQESPQTGSATGSAAVDTRNTLNVVEDAGFFSTTFHVTGTLDLSFPTADQSTRDLLKDARLSVAITMPNWVSEQHGGNLDGNTVTYSVNFGQSATIDVTGGGFNLPHIALILGGVLLALALFIMGLILLRRGGRGPDKGTPAFSVAPYFGPQTGGDAPTLPATPDYPSPPLPQSITPTPE